MARNSLSCSALVIKHWNTGETDRFVTLLTQEEGKFVAVAKGIRKTSSSRSSALEPGNIVKCTIVSTKSLPILSQAILLTDVGRCRESLILVRKLYQLLEIFDRLFVEEELETAAYRQVQRLHAGVTKHQMPVSWIRSELSELISQLGFDTAVEKERSVLEFISELTGKPLRSYEYLLVKSA
ncbi:MAG: DNA repair protein RecO [Patescibacteria group bacterium]